MTTKTERLIERVRACLSDDLRTPPWRGMTFHPTVGHCYVVSEALYHLLGGARAGWVPMNVRHEFVSHWFLRNRDTGEVVDATEEQFRLDVPRSKARGRGFLTKRPSARARELIRRVRRTDR